MRKAHVPLSRGLWFSVITTEGAMVLILHSQEPGDKLDRSPDSASPDGVDRDGSGAEKSTPGNWQTRKHCLTRFLPSTLLFQWNQQFINQMYHSKVIKSRKPKIVRLSILHFTEEIK